MSGFGASETDRRLMNAVRYGTVTAVDPGNARARVTFGGETESEWLPFTATRAGAARVWTPPIVGEQVVVVSPSGDTAQGIIAASLPSSAYPAPSSDGGALVLDLGEVNVTATASDVTVVVGGVTLGITTSDLTVAIGGMTMAVTASDLTVQVGGVTFEISGGGVAITGGTITHNGVNIGDTHIHPESVGVLTGPPQ